MSKSKVMNNEEISSKNIFTIDCKDIVLREFRLEDLDELYNLTLQPEITDYLPDWKSTKEQRKEWLIDFHIKSNKEFLEAVPNIGEQWLNLGIILKETNEFIGWCCTGPKDELPLPNREIAYAISRDYRSKGYTTQAAEGLVKYLFENTNVEVLNAIALTHNIPSNRVIQKCGFSYINIIEIEDEEFHHYKLSKNEWIGKNDCFANC
jgi:RimJ/RimL family protein N-acetyltransferase